MESPNGYQSGFVSKWSSRPVRKFGFLFSADQRNPLGRKPARNRSEKRSASPPFRISPARTREDINAVAELFAAYAAELPIDLRYQDFSSELAKLPGKYAPPEGELLVAWDDRDCPVGCVGMRSLDYSNRCEMKRLYIVPEARSLGLGKTLTEAIIEEARSRGYSELVLDTLPTMKTAASLYGRLGFRRVEAYYRPTPSGTLFMSLDLKLPVRAEHN